MAFKAAPFVFMGILIGIELLAAAEDLERIKGTHKRKGEVAESVFLAKAVQLGFGVAKPWGDSERYDFILDSGGELWRVQVKSAYLGSAHGGYTINGHGNGNQKLYTPEDVDVIVAYIVPEDAWYVIPIGAFAGTQSTRLYPANRRRPSKLEKYREAWCWMACQKEGMDVTKRCGGFGQCPLRQGLAEED